MKSLIKKSISSSSTEESRSVFEKPIPQSLDYYKAVIPIATRWSDNDIYGHVNNVVYYAWFDTAVNSYLIKQGALDLHRGAVIGLVVETHCSYFTPIAFPQTVLVGMRVVHIGNSSAKYEMGIFADNKINYEFNTRSDIHTASACGHFVHVYVDKATRRPVKITGLLKNTLQKLTKD